MFNVRIIEYPTGYQVKVYDAWLGVAEEEDGVVKEERDKRFKEEFERDVWFDVPYEFDDVGDIAAEKHAECVRVSLNRTKNNIYYLARSNVWEWFVTLTLDPAKMDRYDYKECSAKVRKWFNNLRQRVCKSMYYLIVPERHKDGAWHFHGLLGGCSGLSFVDSGKVDSSGNPIYNFENWKYGFSTATRVVDSARASSYICKYISKELCEITSGRQRYWVSNNVERAKVYDACVPWMKMKEFREGLFDCMTWKKKAFTEFFDVEYFEVSKDWNGAVFVESEEFYVE